LGCLFVWFFLVFSIIVAIAHISGNQVKALARENCWLRHYRELCWACRITTLPPRTAARRCACSGCCLYPIYAVLLQAVAWQP
jgi:hypothetical protein